MENIENDWQQRKIKQNQSNIVFSGESLPLAGTPLYYCKKIPGLNYLGGQKHFCVDFKCSPHVHLFYLFILWLHQKF